MPCPAQVKRKPAVNPDLPYQIALTLAANVGVIRAKKLIAHCGSAEAVWKSRRSLLQKIPDIGEAAAGSIALPHTLQRAEEELLFAQTNGITPLSYLDENYPRRLKQCDDSPIVLYAKGNADLNARRIVSVVGTRTATPYGKRLCETLMQDLVNLGYSPLIVSGLAFGIDIAAHRAALQCGLPTAAVMAHGLDITYPAAHGRTLDEMLFAGGAVVSEFVSATKMHAANFVRRNRIIAGIADAVVVAESAERGGSLITAQLAVDYARDVYAFPARTDDRQSAGCNALIRDNRAGLITSALDLASAMRWDAEPKRRRRPSERPALAPDEEKIYTLLCETGAQSIDEICRLAQLSAAETSAVLLSLEFNGMVNALPGKVFEAVGW